PSQDAPLFGAYKIGYKSGSYTTATPPVANFDNTFGNEKVKGGEIGLKSRWLERSMIFNLAAYDYKYSGLQVGAIVPVEKGIPVTKVVNAGSATVKGIEAEINYRPPQFETLTLHGSAVYNKAKYNKLDHV